MQDDGEIIILELLCTGSEEIAMQQLEKLNCNKSYRVNGFHPKIPKEVKNKIAELLIKICNSSLKMMMTTPEGGQQSIHLLKSC